MIRVREATQADVLSILGLIRHLHAEFVDQLPPLHMDNVYMAVRRVMTEGVCLVAVKDDIVTGSIGCIRTGYWFSMTPMLSDLWFYVLPEHRGRAGLDLLRAIKARAADQRMDLVLGVSTGDPDGRKAKLYERMGLRPIGGQYTTR